VAALFHAHPALAFGQSQALSPSLRPAYSLAEESPAPAFAGQPWEPIKETVSAVANFALVLSLPRELAPLGAGWGVELQEDESAQTEVASASPPQHVQH